MSARRRPTRLGAPAFTLVELLAAVIVIAVIGLVASGLIVRVATTNADTVTRGQVQSDLSAAMERIDRELRQIPARTGSTAPHIDAVTPTSITFGASSSIGLSSGTLTISTGGSPATLLTGVSAMTVQCYDESNSALATTLSGSACDAIRRIMVTITVTRAGLSDSLRTKVYLRCTMAGAAEGS